MRGGQEGDVRLGEDGGRDKPFVGEGDAQAGGAGGAEVGVEVEGVGDW